MAESVYANVDQLLDQALVDEGDCIALTCRSDLYHPAMKTILALLALLLPSILMAQEVACPESLPEGSVEVRRPPAEWVGVSTSTARLTGGGVMSGHPKDMAYLVPHRSEKIKGGTRTAWTFDAGEEKWLWCTYGSTAVQIARRMNDSATSCTLDTTFERPGVIRRLVATCR